MLAGDFFHGSCRKGEFFFRVNVVIQLSMKLVQHTRNWEDKKVRNKVYLNNSRRFCSDKIWISGLESRKKSIFKSRHLSLALCTEL